MLRQTWLLILVVFSVTSNVQGESPPDGTQTYEQILRETLPSIVVISDSGGSAAFAEDSKDVSIDGEGSQGISLNDETPQVGQSDATTDSDDMEEGSSESDAQRRTGFDPAVVARGQSAFGDSCTVCHDADRSLSKRKSLSGWLATVRRMSRMEDADIDSADLVPIATYLASLNPTTDPGDGENGTETASSADVDVGVDSPASFSGTISTIWRGGNDNLENPDFFPDVWLTADWQPDGPLRGRVTACTSCHSDQTGGGGFTLELVEATAHFDLMHWLGEECEPIVEAEAKAGRFVVPFGAFASMSHPGIYRTVTNPLMYNMGRQVNMDATRPPVLPMPYSDEGASIDVRVPVWREITAALDVYVVNGLQGFGPGIQFTPSRSYTDNNSDPSVGGRATIGNRTLRVGGSVMSGRMQDEGTPPLDYHLSGADVTFRYEDLLRMYFEYALRRNESDFGRGQIVYGTVYEAELFLLGDPNVNLLARYDTLEHRDGFGDYSIARFTWGINTTLPGGSLLIVNHERWNFSDPEPDIDVIGFRWVATF